nr:glycosyltransferase family 2 protein [Hymenobacter terricola]
MTTLYILFCIAFGVVVYTYLGYGLVVWALARLINFRKKSSAFQPFAPAVTLIVPAYNEAAIIEAKITNCLALDYPADKFKMLFITDGSKDNSGQILARYPSIQHLHSPIRGGKSMAENRAMEFVTTPYVVFTDCNTHLNPQAIRELVKHYQNPQVGAVSGEKKVRADTTKPGAGEGLYWKYESFLKRCDSAVHSLMGAAGELVSFRSDLFRPLEPDTILDDFVQSLRIVEQGYTVVYEPEAFATEEPSASLAEEMERKVRICAGGWQAMSRLKGLLNPFNQPLATFLYISHRVLRWSVAPVALALLLPLSAGLAWLEGGFYWLFFALQAAFYLAAWQGWRTESTASKALVVPLYFCMMNVAVFAGFWRFIKKAQPAAWEKATRTHREALALD